LKSTKILVLSLLLVCGLVASTNAQFYVKVGGGYSFLPVAGFPFNDKTVPFFFESGDSTGSISYKSFGMGVQPVLGFGYYVTKNIALELDAMYLIGQKLESTPETGVTAKMWGEGIFISPAVKLVAPLKGFSPYVRMGLVIGIPKVKVEGDMTTPVAFNVKYEFKGGMSMGMEAALGVDIQASKMINVFVELNGMALNYAPDELENTENTLAGATLEPTYTFKDWDRPYAPFGNFGGKVGVSILFGKMPKK
jgi:outer membrane protein W